MTFPGLLILVAVAGTLFYVGYKSAKTKEKTEEVHECGCGNDCPCKSGQN